MDEGGWEAVYPEAEEKESLVTKVDLADTVAMS